LAQRLIFIGNDGRLQRHLEQTASPVLPSAAAYLAATAGILVFRETTYIIRCDVAHCVVAAAAAAKPEKLGTAHVVPNKRVAANGVAAGCCQASSLVRHRRRDETAARRRSGASAEMTWREE